MTLPSTDPADIAQNGWLADVRRAAESLEESLADRGRLAAVAQAIAEAAASANAAMVTGASPLGHQLAGAVAGQERARVTLWARNGAHGTVLVVEGVLVSGAQISRTARQALAAGATDVVGLAVVADSAGLAATRRELRVVALSEVELVV